MTNEEKMIKNRMGSKNLFKVPEGYFDSFASQMIKQLSEHPSGNKAIKTEALSLYKKIRPLYYAAACLLAVVLSTTIYLSHSIDSSEPQPLSMQVVSEDSYYENITDYVMVDNYEIYACLTSEIDEL